MRRAASVISGIAGGGIGAIGGALVAGGKDKSRAALDYEKDASGLPPPSTVLPVSLGSVPKAVKPSTIAKAVKSMKPMVGKVAEEDGRMRDMDNERPERKSSLLAKGVGAAAGGGAMAAYQKHKMSPSTLRETFRRVPESRAALKSFGRTGSRAFLRGVSAANIGLGATAGAVGAHMLTRKPVEKAASEDTMRFQFVKKANPEQRDGDLVSQQTLAGKGGGGKGMAFKKKAKDGEKEAGQEGNLEGNPGAFTDAFAAFIGEDKGVVTARTPFTPLDNGSERR
jgi:hypothetical protein